MGATLMAWTMPADASSVSLARHRVIDLLRAHGWDDQHIDEAALMTTELATNAVVHAGTPFTVTIDLTAQTLRVDVHDNGCSEPVAGGIPSPSALGGRGLALVAAFADRWGFEPAGRGKSVWFEAVAPSH